MRWCCRQDCLGYEKKSLMCRCLSGGDAGDLIRRMALLKGKLAEAHRGQEVAEE
jgi:hypothetical protein